MKYHINSKVFEAYGVTPQLCVLDTIHFFEFNSAKSEDANFICFASNKAIAELALKKTEAYGMQLTMKQIKDCLANCQQNGKLIRVSNFPNGNDTPLCPLTTNKYVWMTKIRAGMAQEELDALKKKKTRTPFEKRRPELVEVRDRLIEILKDRGISVIGKERQVEAQCEKIEKHLGIAANSTAYMLSGYADFLESGPYLYQLEKNKYTPRLTSVLDISGKFDKIRHFKDDDSTWYDPHKHLLRDFNN